MELQTPCGCGRIDAFGETDERYTERLQVIEQQDQMAKTSTQAVQAPHKQHIEPAPLRIYNEPIKLGPSVFRTADADIDVFGGSPTARLGVAPQFEKLIVD